MTATIEKYLELLFNLRARIDAGDKITFRELPSDGRLKPVLLFLGIIEKIKPMTYKWKGDNPDTEMAETIYREIRKKRIKKHNPLKRRQKQYERYIGYFE
jgi:hypothetical protein